ncbi:TetR/AcrR family transcriptional regulator [Thermocrispum agreste]|jgi:AcrR family transcriptional regulator|nr:TetR/AcrR family transcriptional regulator [Thermocrispum agreste]
MPKRVDHEERRQLIAAAVRRIAADRGLEGVSLGEVATEAGISKGLVQHYFASKDEMLRYATGTLREQVDRRVGTDLPEGLAGLRMILLALLPRDAASRTDALVANAFFVRALKDPIIAERFRTGHEQLRHGVAAMISTAQQAGELNADCDPVTEADLLIAVVTGLIDAILLGHRTIEEAERLIDHQLARLAAQ